jgi:hypothetical protein
VNPFANENPEHIAFNTSLSAFVAFAFNVQPGGNHAVYLMSISAI